MTNNLNDNLLMQDALETIKNKEKQAMRSDSILKIEQEEIIVSGRGRTIREAYIDAFDEMKKKAYKNFKNFLIHLEPIDVIELDDQGTLESHRLLGAFVPHKKIVFNVKLKIVVEAKYIDLA